MGNTSIIEINHDRVGEIEEDPEAFVQSILDQCNSFEYSKGEKSNLILGGEVVAGFHRRYSKEDELWQEFKQKLKKLYD